MADAYRFRPGKLRCPSGTRGIRPVVIALCGSFNPVHNTHLALYEAAKSRLLLLPDRDQDASAAQPSFEVLGGFLSPVSDLYGKPGLAPLRHRLAILDAALAGHPELEVDCWEGLQPRYTRTVHVLSHLEDTVQAWVRDSDAADGAAPVRVVFACGADLFASFFKPGCWPLTLLQQLLDRFTLVVVGRPGFGNDVSSLATQAKDPARCRLVEESEDGVISLDLSRYNFLFTVFDMEDDTSSTKVRSLARELSRAPSGKSEAVEKQAARTALEKLVPCAAVDLIVKYYGGDH